MHAKNKINVKNGEGKRPPSSSCSCVCQQPPPSKHKGTRCLCRQHQVDRWMMEAWPLCVNCPLGELFNLGASLFFSVVSSMCVSSVEWTFAFACPLFFILALLEPNNNWQSCHKYMHGIWRSNAFVASIMVTTVGTILKRKLGALTDRSRNETGIQAGAEENRS